MIWFFVIVVPITMFVAVSFREWPYGTVIANLWVFSAIYWGQAIGAKNAQKKFDRYFGKNGLYVPERKVIYKWNLTVGEWHMRIFPLKPVIDTNAWYTYYAAGKNRSVGKRLWPIK